LKNPGQSQGIKLHLRAVKLDSFRQLSLFQGVGLVIYQPNFLRKNHSKVRNPLHHNVLLIQTGFHGVARDGGKFARRKPRCEGQLSVDKPGLRLDSPAQV